MDKDRLIHRLRLTAERIANWRHEADRLRATAGAVGGKSELVAIEELAAEIYREIDAFNALVADIDRQSHAAAGEIAEVGDALRLVLLEITELSLVMYRLEGDVATAPPALSA